MLKEDVGRWTVTDAEELYEVNRWGNGYFSVGENGTSWSIPAAIHLNRLT